MIELIHKLSFAIIKKRKIMEKITTVILISLMFQACSMKPKDADTSWIKNKHLDIAYSNESTAQKLDIYLPDKLGKIQDFKQALSKLRCKGYEYFN